MSKQPVGKKPTVEDAFPTYFSPGWYRKAMGISGHEPDSEFTSVTFSAPFSAPSVSQILADGEPMPGPETVKPKPVSQSSTLGLYLTKWLDGASGGRVFLKHRAGRFYHFKCTTCGDNWNVGEELFTANGQDAVPSELTEWVHKHHHVCNKWQGNPDWKNGSLSGRCDACKWPYHRHQEAQPVYDAAKNEWLAPGSKVSTDSSVKIAKSPTGRKFR